jgi:hypothetical protein
MKQTIALEDKKNLRKQINRNINNIGSDDEGKGKVVPVLN